MSHLLPCPGCNRHVLNTEPSCPFCSRALDLADRPAPELPRSRLGRAATFAFGATIVGATAIVACSGETESPDPGTGGAAGAGGNSSGGSMNNSGGSNGSGGSNSGGSNSGGSNATGGASTGGSGMVPDDGGAAPLYGLPGPVYGAPP